MEDGCWSPVEASVIIVDKEDGTAGGGLYIDEDEAEGGGARVDDEILSEYAIGRDVGGFSTAERGILDLFNSFPSLTLLLSLLLPLLLLLISP